MARSAAQKLVHNEQTKLFAIYVNSVAVALFVAGVVAPLLTVITGNGQVGVLQPALVMVCCAMQLRTTLSGEALASGTGRMGNWDFFVAFGMGPIGLVVLGVVAYLFGVREQRRYFAEHPELPNPFEHKHAPHRTPAE